jgi:hypothetical protein
MSGVPSSSMPEKYSYGVAVFLLSRPVQHKLCKLKGLVPVAELILAMLDWSNTFGSYRTLPCACPLQCPASAVLHCKHRDQQLHCMPG